MPGRRGEKSTVKRPKGGQAKTTVKEVSATATRDGTIKE
jgi:hypothetical protein